MKKIIILFLISLFLYGADKTGWLGEPKRVLEKTLSLRITLPTPQDKERERLKEESLELLAKLVDQRNLITENEALRIQLGAPRPAFGGGQKFLPAKVLGGNINSLIIDKGKVDGLRVGQTVVYKNILVGKITSLSEERARIELPIAPGTKIPAKTARGALGVVIGEGGGMLLDSVTLSENLEAKDLVLTEGTLEEKKDEESGFLPDLLIGEIERVFKDERALFQQAEIKSPLDFKSLENVFIIL